MFGEKFNVISIIPPVILIVQVVAESWFANDFLFYFDELILQ